MTDYIMCCVCQCLFGGKDGLSALMSGWMWKSKNWYCPKCKKETESK